MANPNERHSTEKFSTDDKADQKSRQQQADVPAGNREHNPNRENPNSGSEGDRKGRSSQQGGDMGQGKQSS